MCFQVQWYYQDTETEDWSAFPSEINIALEEALQEKLPGINVIRDGQEYKIDLGSIMLWHKKVPAIDAGDAGDAGDACDAGDAGNGHDNDAESGTMYMDIEIKRSVLGETISLVVL